MNKNKSDINAVDLVTVALALKAHRAFEPEAPNLGEEDLARAFSVLKKAQGVIARDGQSEADIIQAKAMKADGIRDQQSERRERSVKQAMEELGYKGKKGFFSAVEATVKCGLFDDSGLVARWRDPNEEGLKGGIVGWLKAVGQVSPELFSALKELKRKRKSDRGRKGGLAKAAKARSTKISQ